VKKEPWEMTRETYGKTDIGQKFAMTPEYLDRAHRSYIESAISSGKSISPEVMADYPELFTVLTTEMRTAIREQVNKPISEQEASPLLRLVNKESEGFGQHLIKKARIDMDSKKVADLIIELGDVVANRTVTHKENKPPAQTPCTFAIVIRGGVLKCVWKKNVLKNDKLCTIITHPEKGFNTKEWELMAGRALNAFREITA